MVSAIINYGTNPDQKVTDDKGVPEHYLENIPQKTIGDLVKKMPG